MRVPKTKIFLFVLAGIIFSLQTLNPQSLSIPATGYWSLPQSETNKISVTELQPESSVYDNFILTTSENSTELEKFVNKVANGETEEIRGIFSENIFELPVVQQPSGQPGFVSTIQNVVTEFEMPKKYGVTGILAHNFLAGEKFFSLEIGQQIQVIYGDGSIKTYIITSKQSYQALSPNSANSEFVDLGTSEKISATQLFKRIYMGNHHLTLQTCIQQGLEDSWGRLFIIAEPV